MADVAVSLADGYVDPDDTDDFTPNTDPTWDLIWTAAELAAVAGDGIEIQQSTTITVVTTHGPVTVQARLSAYRPYQIPQPVQP